MTRWQNFSIYQITGDGWGNAVEPAGDLAWQTYSAWIAQVLQAQAPEPFEQHFLASYVASLAECCGGPEFPFSLEFWRFLFGIVFIARGGEMIGGRAKLPASTGTLTGLELGGQGVNYNDFILQEDDFPILDEDGNPLLLE